MSAASDWSRLSFEDVFTEHSFALCLTHDVDRVQKSPLHAVFYALAEGDAGHLRDVWPSRNPYWQFDTITDLEADLGVQSAFYFLLEPGLRDLTWEQLREPDTWVQLIGRYDTDTIERALAESGLRDGGWELGLHGSYHSATDPSRLQHETRVLEQLFETEIRGGRQHYLNIDSTTTWRYHRRLGLRYDASLGSSIDYGFEHGYGLVRPFDDQFVVFPTTLMEQTLPDPGTDFEHSWQVCESLLQESAANGAVMTVLWHPRYFSRDFQGYRTLYRRLVDRALDLGAWVGPPGDFYDRYVTRRLSLTA